MNRRRAEKRRRLILGQVRDGLLTPQEAMALLNREAVERTRGEILTPEEEDHPDAP